MKTNKTKPIKKLMIFTIITVMIVSLFAVPAFADVTWPSASGNVTPIDFTYSGDSGSVSVNTDGYYLISFTKDSLLDAINSVGAVYGDPQENPIVTFNPFSYNSTVSYTRVLTSTADVYFYKNEIDGSNDSYILGFTVNINNHVITMSVPHGISTDSYNLTNLTSPELISFIVTEYPPSFTANNMNDHFWNSLQYTVQQYGAATNPPTDPEDPDNPTPPADGEEQGIFAVWTKITQWIVQGLASVSNAFYADGKLTLLGTLCIIPLALGVALLLISIIQKFLRLRG